MTRAEREIWANPPWPDDHVTPVRVGTVRALLAVSRASADFLGAFLECDTGETPEKRAAIVRTGLALADALAAIDQEARP